MDAAEVLTAYDRQIRRSTTPPQPGWTMEYASGGRVLRSVAPAETTWGCFVIWSDLDEETADETIAEQVAFYRGLGRAFEWKWHGYDQPADLRDRLSAAGFQPDAQESLVAGLVDEVVAACCEGATVLDDVTLRHLRDDDSDADYAAIAALNAQVWGGDFGWLVDDVRAERDSMPERLLIHLAEAGGEVVSAAWVRFHAGTDFASLWGGATLPQWRRRGIYRALVARRAQEARERGVRYLQVDASDDSLPILQRLGLTRLTDTTPYNWSP